MPLLMSYAPHRYMPLDHHTPRSNHPAPHLGADPWPPN